MPHVALGAKSCFHLPCVDSNWNTDASDRFHSKVRNVHLRYLNATDQNNMAGHFMPPGPGRKGYCFVKGKDSDETVEIAESLGLSEFHVDKAKNRIINSGHILAYIPIEEYEIRMDERRRRAAAQQKGFHQDIVDRINEVEAPGVKGVTIQHGDFMERKVHGERTGKPFVSLSDKWDLADD